MSDWQQNGQNQQPSGQTQQPSGQEQAPAAIVQETENGNAQQEIAEDYMAGLDLFEKAPMVLKVWSILSNTDPIRRKWCNFCEMHSLTTFKPEDADEAFLMTFLESLQLNTVPEMQGLLPGPFIDALTAKNPRAGWAAGKDAAKGAGKDAWTSKGGGNDWSSKGGGGNDWGKGGSEWNRGDSKGSGKKGGGGGGGDAGKVFIGGLQRTTSENDLWGFLGQYGQIKDLTLKYGEDGQCKGFGFVTYSDPSVSATVVAASTAGTTTLHGKWIEVKECRPKGEGKADGKGDSQSGGSKGGSWGSDQGSSWNQGSSWDSDKRQKTDDWGSSNSWNQQSGGQQGKGKGKGSADDEERKIFVGGLPRTTTQESLQAHFANFGAVRSIDLKHDPMGAFRGFGFVVFEDKNTAEQILNNHAGNKFEGKWIDCKRGAKSAGK